MSTPASDAFGRTLRGDWQVLESIATAGLASLPLADFEAEGARIASDESGARHLLVRTSLPSRSWSQIDSPMKDAVHTLTFGGVRENYLDVRCASTALFEVFDALIADVLEASRGAADPGRAVDVSLSQWRAMFRAVSSGAFGKDRRYGLFAELKVMESCVDQIGDAAVGMWTGPLGRPHDFELPAGCLEVKAVGATSTDVTIHGFGQLLPDGDPLDLIVLTIGESATGQTIAELIASIESRVGVGGLSAALARTGYEGSAPDERLVVMDSFAVRVDERVPALTVRTVDSETLSRLTHVEYDVPLALLAQLAAPEPTSAVIARAANA